MKRFIVPSALVAILLVGLTWALLQRNQKADAPATNSTSTSETSEEAPATGIKDDETLPETSVSQILVYTSKGFSPSTFTVKAGSMILISNESDKVLDFASDEHPTHTKQAQLNIGIIAAGKTKTLTVTEKGTWGFHNHENASHVGAVTVE